MSGDRQGDAYASRQYEINVGRLITAVRRQRSFFLAGFLFVLTCALIYLHLAPREYTVTMEMTSTSPQGTLSSKLGALGSIAGVDLGSDPGTANFKIFLDTLQSPIAAEQLMRHPDLLIEMFPKEWSVSDRKWHEPPSAVRPLVRAIQAVLGIPTTPWSPPSTYRVYNYLQSQLRVAQDPKSGVVTLQIENENPELSVKLLNALVHDVDELMRKRVLARTSGYIDYLQAKLQTLTVAEYRQALLENLADQEKQRMIASGQVSYVSEFLGSPVTSLSPTSPAALPILLLACAVGVFAGVVLSSLADRRGWRFPAANVLGQVLHLRRASVK
jgi:uncharacterized protein involved in exopolysaccharide biosynthesis